MKEIITNAAADAARSAIRAICGAVGTAAGAFISSVLVQLMLGKGEQAPMTNCGGVQVEEAPPGSIW